jgi:hypothetical protein
VTVETKEENTTMSRPNLTEEIESLIDQSSVLDVLTAIELICAEKAEHIRHNWQDRATARPWDKVSKIVGNAAHKTQAEGI